MWKKLGWKKSIIIILISFLMLYLLSAFIVFDFTSPATPNDEEYYNGQLVAYGPKPRTIFCAPSRGGFLYYDYDGNEWPFKVYPIVCRVWRYLNGYAKPYSLRRLD